MNCGSVCCDPLRSALVWAGEISPLARVGSNLAKSVFVPFGTAASLVLHSPDDGSR